jgi:hypothetical protein
VQFAEIILPNEHELSVLIQLRPRAPSGTSRSAAKVTLCSTGTRAWVVLTETLVQNPDPQVRASRAGIGIAAPIYTLLLSLVIADAKRHDEGGRCVVAQERLAQLRAQIAEVEQEVQAACPAGVALDPPRPTWEEAAGHMWAGGPVRQPIPDAASTTSGGRRRQTSGPAPPSSTSTKMYCTVRYRM